RGGHRPLDGSQQRCWRRQPHLTSLRHPISLLPRKPRPRRPPASPARGGYQQAPPAAVTGCSLRCPAARHAFSPSRNPPKIDRPDLIVLDVMLPDMDGFDVVRRLRGGGDRIPVVFLTARDAMDDKIRGLTLGGDDYVTKPFSLEEVIARIRAVLRRTRGDGAEPTPRLKFADLELDEDSHEVWRNGTQIQLSPTEFKLLRYFMSNANRVLSKMQILDH